MAEHVDRSKDSEKNTETNDIPMSADNLSEKEKKIDKEKETQKEETEDNTETVQKEKDEKKEEPKQTGPKLLDLAFGMDCTGSMGSYIASAQKGIRNIVEEIVSKEAADVKLALVEYRDHPPQDNSFVTRVHDFTKSVREMKGWLDACAAQGGGDGPEAVADALHQLLKLSWRPDATKICVFISDAPPHGLDTGGDGFPNGCPDGLDPMTIVAQMAEKGITLYQVGCEPAINRYKEFFTGLAHVTGGQYVPLRRAELLAKVIVGGAQEEISLQELMAEVNQEVQLEVNTAVRGALSTTDISSRVYTKLASKGYKSKQMTYNQMALPQASKQAKELSYATNMKEANSLWSQGASAAQSSHGLAMRGSCAPRSVPMTKKRGSMLGGLKSWAFGSKDEKKDSSSARDFVSDEPDDDCLAVASVSSMPLSTPMADDYGVVEGEDIQQEQVYRMVQKSVMQQNLRSQVRKDSD